MSRYRIQRMSINGTVVSGGRSYNLDRGRSREAMVQDGNRYEQGHVVLQATPAIEIASHNLGELFGASSPWNASLDSPCAILASTGLILYGAKEAANISGFDSGAVHVSHAIATGLLCVGGLSWQKGGIAEASVRCMPFKTDGTDPIVEATNVAANALPAAENNVYHGWTLLTANVNGTAIDVESLSVEIDPGVGPIHSRGLPFPTAISGQGQPVRISASLETHDLSLAEGSGASSLVFAKLGTNGGIATGSNTRLTLTFYGPYGWADAITGEQGSPRSKSIMLTTKHDGTNRPLTWAVGAS